MTLLGAHVSVAGGLPRAFERGEAIGCRAIQIFVKNASRWRGRHLGSTEARAFRAALHSSPIETVVAHASYLINIASSDRTIRRKSIKALGDELDRCCELEVSALVLHPGAHLGRGVSRGVECAAAALGAVFSARPTCATRLLLENTAGQGTYLGAALAELGAIIEQSDCSSNLGVCLDTCHAFAAGYDLRRRTGYQRLFDDLEHLGGAASLGCMHLNDSVAPCGSRRDRHANIGRGAIGSRVFGQLVRDSRLRGLPMIVETPLGQDQQGHRLDLQRLRRMRDRH